MKIVRTGIMAGFAFFLSTGISFGVDLDDIDFTIRVVESDDVGEMHNELSLPDMTFDMVYEEGDAGHENEVDEHENEASHEDEMEVRDEREDEIEDHDEAREDTADVKDEHDEAHEDHEEEHKREDD